MPRDFLHVQMMIFEVEWVLDVLKGFVMNLTLPLYIGMLVYIPIKKSFNQ